jgi:hypothetical protein
MTQLTIVTTPANSGDGTPLATAFNYCNNNFNELYSRVQTDPPTTLVGVIGDSAGMYAYDSTFFYYCFADYDGSSVIWGQLTQIANVSVSSISSGTSNVRISDLNGNVVTGINGTSNVVIVSENGQYVGGQISAIGNIRGNYILGNGSQLDGLPQSYSNANVAAFLPVYSGNISAGNISVNSTITATTITTPGTISATGNITTTGFFVGDFAGNIVATISNLPGPGGAVVFNNGVGNAAATAGLVFDNSGPNVLTVDGSYSATGNIIATGNITGVNVIGTNIVGTLTTTAQTNITSVGTLTNLNVTANVAGGNITTGGQVSATGNIRTAGYLFATQDINVGGDITATSYTGTSSSLSGNVAGGNITTGGRVSAVGNITGNYFFGNGSQLVGVSTNSLQNGNSNVLIGSSAGNVSINVRGVSPVVLITPLGQLVSGTCDVSDTISGGNILTNGTVSAVGEIQGADFRTGGFILASGNISGGNVLFGSGIVSGTGNIIGSNLLGVTLSASGNITGGNITGGNITGGNLSAGTGTVTLGNIVNANGTGVGNIGSSITAFNTVFAKATSAQYADLAEIYLPDADYVPGTVVVFGGDKEITVTDQAGDERVAGVISTDPAYLMNTASAGLPVALRGKVPVRVIGPINKGDGLVTSNIPGVALSIGRSRTYAQAVFAKSLETHHGTDEKIIQAVIL